MDIGPCPSEEDTPAASPSVEDIREAVCPSAAATPAATPAADSRSVVDTLLEDFLSEVAASEVEASEVDSEAMMADMPVDTTALL